MEVSPFGHPSHSVLLCLQNCASPQKTVPQRLIQILFSFYIIINKRFEYYNTPTQNPSFSIVNTHLDVYNCSVHLTSKTLRDEQSTSIKSCNVQNREAHESLCELVFSFSPFYKVQSTILLSWCYTEGTHKHSLLLLLLLHMYIYGHHITCVCVCVCVCHRCVHVF